MKKKIIIIYFFLLPLNCKTQNYFGFNLGMNEATLFTYGQNEDYYEDYRFNIGKSAAIFYSTKLEPEIYYRLELQYVNQKSNLEVQYKSKNGFYKNMELEFDRINMNLLFSFQLRKNNNFFNLIIGPYFSGLIQTSVTGYGWDIKLETQIDSLGNDKYFLKTDFWEKNNTISNELVSFFVGFNVGFESFIPINKKIEFHIINKYNLSLTSVVRYKHARYTPLFTGFLNIGLRFKISD